MKSEILSYGRGELPILGTRIEPNDEQEDEKSPSSDSVWDILVSKADVGYRPNSVSQSGSF